MLDSKNILRSIGFTIVIFAQSLTALAGQVSSDMKGCAKIALAERQQSVKSITVSNDTNGERSEFDHDISATSISYRMLLNNKSTGAKLGVIKCNISSNGEITEASFES